MTDDMSNEENPAPTPDGLMRAYYAARAPEYDAIYRKPERQADLRAIEQWVPSKFVGAGVLEIACGTGYWTRFIAPVARHVTALDAAPETLDIGRARVPGSNVEFVVGDAYDPPRNTHFDAAFCGFWFSHVPRARQREFLSALNAALRPGAMVVMLDNRYVEGSSTPVSEHDADGNGYQARKLADGSTHLVLKNFPSESELRSLVADLGEHAAFTSWSYYWAFEYRVA
jgi:demethylmenaquinone methyltransferase/2-methoxy-6-polyprenyl-1,4-benzoquinol methylase